MTRVLCFVRPRSTVSQQTWNTLITMLMIAEDGLPNQFLALTGLQYLKKYFYIGSFEGQLVITMPSKCSDMAMKNLMYSIDRALQAAMVHIDTIFLDLMPGVPMDLHWNIVHIHDERRNGTPFKRLSQSI